MKFQSLNEFKDFLNQSLNHNNHSLYDFEFKNINTENSILTINKLNSPKYEIHFNSSNGFDLMEEEQIDEIIFDIHEFVLANTLKMPIEDVNKTWDNISGEHYGFYEEMIKPDYWNNIVNMVTSEFLHEKSTFNNYNYLKYEYEYLFIECKCELDENHNIHQIATYTKGKILNNNDDHNLIHPIVFLREQDDRGGISLQDVQENVLPIIIDHIKDDEQNHLSKTLDKKSKKVKPKTH